MPQLPSGRHAGLDPAPLNKMLDAVLNDTATVTWPIHAIEEQRHVLRHFDLLYFEVSDTLPKANLADESLALAPELSPRKSGHNALWPFTEACDWPVEDINAWAEFLAADRTGVLLDRHWKRVQQFQDALAEDGTPLQLIEARTWRAGVHWLQDKELNGGDAIPSKYSKENG